MKINYPFSLSYCKTFYLTHPHKLIEDIYYWVKHFIQRGLRGYADCDSWSLDYYLNTWMPEAVRSIQNGHGHPISFGEDNPNAIAEWNAVLEEIAKGFEAAKKINDLDFDGPSSTWQEQSLQEQKKMYKGLGLFCKYYLNLWD